MKRCVLQRINRIFYLGILLGILALLLVRAPLAHASGSGNWRTYTISDGLPSNKIQALAYREDALDFPPCAGDNCPRIPGLWVGTDQGLAYLNGRESVIYDDLPSLDVRALLFDRDGLLWVATTGGLVRLNPGNKPWEGRVTTWDKAEFLSGRAVLALTQTLDGHIWAGTSAGLDKVDAETGAVLYTYLAGKRITALPRCPLALSDGCEVETQSGFWVGTDQGLFHLPPDQYHATPVTETPVDQAHISALTLSAAGIWVGSNQGAAFWDGHQWDPDQRFDGVGDLATAHVHAVDVNGAGQVWFATTAGASRWDPRLHRWRRFFAHRDPIAGDQVQALLLDPYATAWFGTDQGLSGNDGSWTLLDSSTVYDFTRQDGLAANDVKVVAIDPAGRTWVGTDGGGVTVFDTHRRVVATFTSETGLMANDVKVVAIDPAGRTWVSTVDFLGRNGGVTIFDTDLRIEATFTTNNGLAANTVEAVVFDPQSGRTWVGTDGGVTVFDTDLSVVETFTSDNALAASNVQAVAVDTQTGRTWVGTFDFSGRNGGVTVFDADLRIEATFTTNNGLAADTVVTLAVDAQTGRTWVGTASGVTVFDADLRTEATFTTNNGLAANTIVAVAVDAQTGRTWVGTASGVTVFDADLRTEATFTSDNALAADNVVALAVDTQTGRTWVGTASGVTIFDADLNVVAIFTSDNVLTTGNVVAVAVDAQTGRTWVGTLGGGVTIFDADLDVVATFTTDNGLVNNFVRTAAIDAQSGRTWIGTDGGVTVFDADLSVVETFTDQNGLVVNFVGIVVVDAQSSHTWVGTLGGGVTVFAADLHIEATFTSQNGPTGNFVGAVAVDPPSGRTWVGTDRGVTVFDADLKVVETFTSQTGLAESYVQTMAVDPAGRTWVGTERTGVTVIDADLKVVETFTSQIGLVADYVRAIAFDAQSGRTWVGTWGGATVFDDDLRVEATFTSQNALAADSVESVAVDATGRTWIGMSDIIESKGNGGVTVLNPIGRLPWLRLSNDALTDQRLLDTQQATVDFIGGSLLAEPLDMAYAVQLTDAATNRVVDTVPFQPGAVGAGGLGQFVAGNQQPLAFGDYTLQLTATDPFFKSYFLPTLSFAVQVSPVLTIEPIAVPRQVEGAAAIASQADIPLEWSAEDADAAAGETPILEYSWSYTGNADTTLWQRAANPTSIRAPRLDPGAPDEQRNLALRAVDADDNPSQPQLIRLTILAPRNYFQLLSRITGVALGLVIVGLVSLARTSGLPLPLLVRQGVLQWVPVGLAYRAYRRRWEALTPLERLIMLMPSPDDLGSPETLQRRLDARQTPVPAERLTQALDNLVRGQWLQRVNECYRAAESHLARALQMQADVTGMQALAATVRAEHPLLAAAKQFFPAAGFELDPLDDPLAFLCRPLSAGWQRLFDAPVYTRLFPDRPLDQEAVIELNRAAQHTRDDAHTLFAIINQAPSDDGWIAIGGLQARETPVRVIPIDDAFMQQARVQQRERQELEAHLRRFLGRQRDLYNVRDPVVDRLNFFGREERAGELLEWLSEGRPVALFGLRKMGKSSLLQVLRERAPFPVAYVDLQAGVELAALYTRILEGWQRALRVKFPAVDWQPPVLAGDLATAFTSAVNDLMRQLETHGHAPRLGLFVDEIELIVPASASSARSGPGAGELQRYLDFARALRGLVQESSQLALLVTGVDPQLNRVIRWGEQQNPFYQFFREEYLEPLDEADCIQMVRNIGRQMGLVYSDPAVDFVAQVSGGHPFLARQLCSVALGLRGDGAGSEVTLNQLQTAADHFVRAPGTASLLDENGLWGEVTNPELWPQPQIDENATLLTSLAQTEPQPEAALSVAGRDEAARARSLVELKQRAVVGHQPDLLAMLRIQFGLFRTWIQRYRLRDLS